MRALAFAQATRPDTLTALTVNIDDEATRALHGRLGAPRPAGTSSTVLDSPYREVTPADDQLHQASCAATVRNDMVTVFIPEYVVGHWWEHLLHNQSALRLKGRLLFQPGVMVTSVPWQLDVERDRGPAPAAAGRPERPDRRRRPRTRCRSGVT